MDIQKGGHQIFVSLFVCTVLLDCTHSGSMRFCKAVKRLGHFQTALLKLEMRKGKHIKKINWKTICLTSHVLLRDPIHYDKSHFCHKKAIHHLAYKARYLPAFKSRFLKKSEEPSPTCRKAPVYSMRT